MGLGFILDAMERSIWGLIALGGGGEVIWLLFEDVMLVML